MLNPEYHKCTFLNPLVTKDAMTFFFHGKKKPGLGNKVRQRSPLKSHWYQSFLTVLKMEGICDSEENIQQLNGLPTCTITSEKLAVCLMSLTTKLLSQIGELVLKKHFTKKYIISCDFKRTKTLNRDFLSFL